MKAMDIIRTRNNGSELKADVMLDLQEVNGRPEVGYYLDPAEQAEPFVFWLDHIELDKISVTKSEIVDDEHFGKTQLSSSMCRVFLSFSIGLAMACQFW